RELNGHTCPLRGAAPARAPLRRAAGRRARVLLVDHLGSARSVLAAALRGAGYHVELVASGPAALAELERQGADVLLTDLYMPEMSGWDLTRLVRARGVASTRGWPLCVGLYSAVLSGVSRPAPRPPAACRRRRSGAGSAVRPDSGRRSPGRGRRSRR